MIWKALIHRYTSNSCNRTDRNRSVGKLAGHSYHRELVSHINRTRHKMVRIGIVGGTGYTGVELLRLLAAHPQARVETITSRSEEGVRVVDMYPNLRGHYDEL